MKTLGIAIYPVSQSILTFGNTFLICLLLCHKKIQWQGQQNHSNAGRMDAAVVETKDALEALRRRWDAQPLAKATRNPSMGNLALGCRLLDVAELNPLHLENGCFESF